MMSSLTLRVFRKAKSLFSNQSQGGKAMPIVNIVLLEGRNQAQKDAMYAEVTQALCRTLGCPPEQVRIMVQDYALGNFAVAGTSVATAREQAARKKEEAS
jgi:4-oxalocrotonate tautomerase